MVVRRLLLLPLLRTGRREWKRSHIRGSGLASLFALSDQHASRLAMATPPPSWFEKSIGGLGVSNDSRVVLYDRRENMWAARLWWLLRSFGFDDAAVLDGGWTAWQQGGHPVSSDPCKYQPATFSAAPRPEIMAT